MYKITNDSAYQIKQIKASPTAPKHKEWKAKKSHKKTRSQYKLEQSDADQEKRQEILSIFGNDLGYREFINKTYKKIDLRSEILLEDPPTIQETSLPQNMSLSTFDWFDALTRIKLSPSEAKTENDRQKNSQFNETLKRTANVYKPFRAEDWRRLRVAYAGYQLIMSGEIKSLNVSETFDPLNTRSIQFMAEIADGNGGSKLVPFRVADRERANPDSSTPATAKKYDLEIPSIKTKNKEGEPLSLREISEAITRLVNDPEIAVDKRDFMDINWSKLAAVPHQHDPIIELFRKGKN